MSITPEQPTQRDPYAEGADAALAGLSETDNPYDLDEDFDAFTSWNDGWLSIAEGDD